MVTVKIFGTLGLDLGQNEFELDLGDGTLADVIDKLSARYGVKVREELLDEEGNLDSAYGVFRAGEQVADLATRIEDGMEVVITNIAGGG